MRNVDESDDEENDMFKCDCGSACEDRLRMVGECPLYEQREKPYMTAVGKSKDAIERP